MAGNVKNKTGSHITEIIDNARECLRKTFIDQDNQEKAVTRLDKEYRNTLKKGFNLVKVKEIF